jgi:poly(A) polymerase Pap1
MTAIDDFFDDAHACLVHIQELLNKLGSINITLPMRDHLTPEETQDALANLLSQETLLEQLKREAEQETHLLRAACEAAKLGIDASHLGRRQKKRKKVAINQAHHQVRNHCQKFDTFVDQLLVHLVDQKQQLMLHNGQDPNQS